MPFCRALYKYGYSNFGLAILKYCEPNKCIKWENDFFLSLKPDYNILKVAGSSLGRKQSEEAKGKIRNARLGKKHLKETRAKMSEIKLGIKQSEEHKKNRSLAQPNCIKIEVLDLETNITTPYLSISAVARALNTRPSSIHTNLNSKRQKPFKGRYVLKKID